MKALKAICTTLVLILPLFMFAQDAAALVGDWTITVPAEDGSLATLVVTMTDAGTYQLDFGGDSTVDSGGTFRVDGDQMVIIDDEDGDCAGARGLYSFTVDESSLVMTRIEDECEGRSGPEGKMEFTRKK